MRAHRHIGADRATRHMDKDDLRDLRDQHMSPERVNEETSTLALCFPSLVKANWSLIVRLRKRITRDDRWHMGAGAYLILCHLLLTVVLVLPDQLHQPPRPSHLGAVCLVAFPVMLPVYGLVALCWWCSRVITRTWREYGKSDLFMLPFTRELFWTLYYRPVTHTAMWSVGVVIVCTFATVLALSPNPANATAASFILGLGVALPLTPWAFLVTSALCAAAIKQSLRAAGTATEIAGVIRYLLITAGVVTANLLAGALVVYGACGVMGLDPPQGSRRVLLAICASLPIHVSVCILMLRDFDRHHLEWFRDAVSRVADRNC